MNMGEDSLCAIGSRIGYENKQIQYRVKVS